jgi:hypothetical protein
MDLLMLSDIKPDRFQGFEHPFSNATYNFANGELWDDSLAFLETAETAPAF